MTALGRDPDPPAAAYWFSPDRKGEHPRAHLADFNGILQADAYTGFRQLYEPGSDGVARVREAACWAHLRRDFHDVWKATDSPVAREALERIGALYDIEAAINGQAARGPPRHAPETEPPEGRGLPRLVRAPADPDPRQGRSGQGHALRPEPLGELRPVPRRRPRRHRHG